MLVVEATADTFTLLEYFDPAGQAHTKTLGKSVVADIHDRAAGGEGIAYLLKPERPHP